MESSQRRGRLAPVTHERDRGSRSLLSLPRTDGRRAGRHGGLTDDGGDRRRALAGHHARWGAHARAALVSPYTAGDPGAAGNR
jgi:hypothetical protein